MRLLVMCSVILTSAGMLFLMVSGVFCVSSSILSLNYHLSFIFLWFRNEIKVEQEEEPKMCFSLIFFTYKY